MAPPMTAPHEIEGMAHVPGRASGTLSCGPAAAAADEVALINESVSEAESLAAAVCAADSGDEVRALLDLPSP